MNIAILLQMAADAMADRRAVGLRDGGKTYGALFDQARRLSGYISSSEYHRLVAVDLNSDMLPTLLMGAAWSGTPFVPINYRLSDEQLRRLLERTAPALAVVDESVIGRVGEIDGVGFLTKDELDRKIKELSPIETVSAQSDDVAVMLFTSGTSGAPKAAMLRHRHLSSYVLSSVDLMSAGADEAALISVPPYHVAGMAAILTSLYCGRRIVYLPQFDPEAWVDTARDERVTHAMVVPTMLGRILDVLEQHGEDLPALQRLAYGGGRMPLATVERATRLLPHVGLVNAYGLTETSSTITLLGPEDHRTAYESSDPVVRARLESVGRPLPSVELEVRDESGRPLPPGQVGEIFVRGEQVAGEYFGRDDIKTDGWFATRDQGWLDSAGYLFVQGRQDDVIVRGGENIAPAEVEKVLGEHPAVAEAAVVGIPDTEWGETVAAAVVLEQGASAPIDELQEWVRSRLRTARTPTAIAFREELPYNEMGKLLRKVIKAELASN